MQKNLIFFLALIFSTSAQIFSSSESEPRKTRCCDLGTLAYKVGSKFGRNDYLYLANANAVWWLKKKIAQKEDLQSLDEHSIKYGNGGQFNVGLWVKHTPLQEAVIMGNFEAAQILLEAGADRNKKTESFAHEMVDINKFKLLPTPTAQQQEEIQRLNKQNNIGLTAVGLAKKLAETPQKSDYVSPAKRQAIYVLLRKEN